MTVKELIAELEKFDEDLDVRISINLKSEAAEEVYQSGNDELYIV